MACKTAPTAWPIRSTPPVLPTGEIHLWAVSLELTRSEQEAMVSLLSEEERARARRLAASPGAQFAAARGALRILLGAYLDVMPASLAFAVTATGKPFLEDAAWLRFNLAHSHALALVAVARDTEVGIDVERRRVVESAAVLAARYLTPDEAQAIGVLPEDARSDAFLRCWTLKEAVLKATGTALSQALDSFRVAAAPDRWSLHALEPSPGYVGALAVESPSCRLRCFTLSPGEPAADGSTSPR